MLDSKLPAVRSGGISALGSLAQDYPEVYHIQIMDILSAFARRPGHDLDDLDDTTRSGDGSGNCGESLRTEVRGIG